MQGLTTEVGLVWALSHDAVEYLPEGSNGGTVFSSLGAIGGGTTASNNSVFVTGSHSGWNNSGDLYVGYSGAGNSLTIADGGAVYNASGDIGYDTGASSNSVTVTGSNSVWNNNGD